MWSLYVGGGAQIMLSLSFDRCLALETAGVFSICLLLVTENGVCDDIPEIWAVLVHKYDVIQIVLKFICTIYDEIQTGCCESDPRHSDDVL